MRIVSVLSCSQKHKIYAAATAGKKQQYIAMDFDVSVGTVQRVLAEMRQYSGMTQKEYKDKNPVTPVVPVTAKAEVNKAPQDFTYQDIRDCKLYKENEWRFAAYEANFKKIVGYSNMAELFLIAIKDNCGRFKPNETSLMHGFNWAGTRFGHTFWSNMYRLAKPEPVAAPVAAPAKPALTLPKSPKDFTYQDIRDCKLYKENEWRFAAYEAKYGKIADAKNFAELLMTIVKQLSSKDSQQYFHFGTSELNLAFSWYYSPQGRDFWYKMNQLVKPVETKVEQMAARLASITTASNKEWWSGLIDSEINKKTWIAKPGTPELPTVKPVAKVEEPVKPTMQYVITPVNVLFLVDGKQYSADVSHKNFAEIVLAVTNNDAQRAVDLADVSTAIERYMAGHVKVEGGVVTYQGMAMHGGMTDRIIAAMSKGDKGKVSVLVAFFNNLMENPSRRAVNELFGFLEANDIEITDDGYFYAWKKVRGDYLDIYTGTMDNSPGKMVQVPRNQVDENSDVTCSQGLHVCSKSYLRHYGCRAGNKVVKCKVHPRDVVAIPKDYNNAKMRCAGYYVVEDVSDSLDY